MVDQTPSNEIAGGTDNSAFRVTVPSTAAPAKGSATQLDWEALLCDWRESYDGTEAGPPDDIPDRSQFESDYDRVVFSQPFRRLARKTQVHPMALNDHVHNRLTHSIEVASVGRSFGRRLGQLLTRKSELPEDRSENDLVWILMASCAAHDIGNPPFGHAGEEAIRDWSKSHRETVFPNLLDTSVENDVLAFEGNAQGFRVACRSDNDLAGHLRLTYATLGAMVKYPWPSDDKRAKASKKYNYFSTEKEIFQSVFRKMGLIKNGAFVRHPLSFLCEAADDICYRVLDLEDAAELNLITSDRVREVFDMFLQKEDYDSGQPLGKLRSSVIQKLIDECWDVFEKDYEAIMAGSREIPLKDGLPRKILNALKKVEDIYVQIFSEQYKVITELGAYKALGRTLKAMCLAIQDLKAKSEWDELPFVSRRCFDLAWGKDYVVKHWHEDYGWWLHQVLDYVAGMTDNSAMKISRGIEGI